MIPLSRLSIASLRRPGERYENGTYKTARHSWDFVVDGVSLRFRWQDRDLAGVLGWGLPEAVRETAAKLRRDAPPDYPPDRVAILVCPECGDLGCGAVTVGIRREGETVTWSDFRWEVNWFADHPEESTVSYDVGPFRFDFQAYDDILNQAVSRGPEAS